MAEHKTVIPCLEAIQEYVGRTLGPSEWIPVSQQRIDAFADATDDHQWIHTDPERASRESRWKTTIAHGYLTLALTPRLLDRILQIDGCSSAVNTGLEKLRLAAPVPSGSRVRMRAEIRDARAMPRSGVRVSFAVRIEVEGGTKPALLANVNYVYLP
ncbi:MAG: MaoC family dehydratase [Deltaproteobacteria bacterium]|nr:MaoC family dehydratase [Deltaproteobacteria bacterium]MBW2359516.1 MaoC family dehydratase [Deltaproteobacteria bacterium]